MAVKRHSELIPWRQEELAPGYGGLVQVVHGRNPRGAQRLSCGWRSEAREGPVDPPGQACLTPPAADRAPSLIWFAQSQPAYGRGQFLCSAAEPVSSPRPALLRRRRAPWMSRLAVAPTLPNTLTLPGHALMSTSTVAGSMRWGENAPPVRSGSASRSTPRKNFRSPYIRSALTRAQPISRMRGKGSEAGADGTNLWTGLEPWNMRRSRVHPGSPCAAL